MQRDKEGAEAAEGHKSRKKNKHVVEFVRAHSPASATLNKTFQTNAHDVQDEEALKAELMAMDFHTELRRLASAHGVASTGTTRATMAAELAAKGIRPPRQFVDHDGAGGAVEEEEKPEENFLGKKVELGLQISLSLSV